MYVGWVQDFWCIRGPASVWGWWVVGGGRGEVFPGKSHCLVNLELCSNSERLSWLLFSLPFTQHLKQSSLSWHIIYVQLWLLSFALFGLDLAKLTHVHAVELCGVFFYQIFFKFLIYFAVTRTLGVSCIYAPGISQIFRLTHHHHALSFLSIWLEKEHC